MPWKHVLVVAVAVIVVMSVLQASAQASEKTYIIEIRNLADFSITGFVAEVWLTQLVMEDIGVLVNNLDTLYVVDASGVCLWFWIESYNNTPGAEYLHLFIRTETIPAYTAYRVYLKYGGLNPCPGYNDPNRVFLLFDDFRGGMKPGWEIIGTGSVSFGPDYVEITTPNGSAVYIRYSFNTTYEGLKIITYGQDLLTNGDAGLQVVLEGPSRGVFRNAYLLELHGTDLLYIARMDNNILRYQGVIRALTLDPNSVYKLRLSKSNNATQAFIEDRGVYGVDGTYNITAVAIGFYWGNELPDTVRIYRVMVFPWIWPEPQIIYPIKVVEVPVGISRIEMPKTTEAAIDAVASIVLLAGGIVSALYYLYTRNEWVLLFAGVVVVLVSLGALAARAGIPVEQYVENGTLRFRYDVNPYANVYVAPMLLGLLLVVLWFLRHVMLRRWMGPWIR